MTLYLGDFVQGDTIRFTWTTRDSTGAGIVRSTDGTISAYEDGGTTQITAGITDTESFDMVTGLNLCAIAATSANGYDTNKTYDVVLTGATIDTVAAAPEVLAKFTLSQADVYSSRIAAVRQSSTVHVYYAQIIFNGDILPAADLANVKLIVKEVLNSAGDTAGTTKINAVAMTQVTGEDAYYLRDTTALVATGIMHMARLTFDHLDRTGQTAWAEVFYRDG